MDEKTQQQNFDQVLFEKLAKAQSETVITLAEAQRLAKLFGNYQKRYPIVFGGGVKKIQRDWML